MNTIIKTSSQSEFAKAACEKIKKQAFKKIKEKGNFTLVLSGGKTPKIIFNELISNYRKSIDWSKTFFFWLDERCIHPEDERSNFKLAYDHLISKLNNVGSIYRINGEIDAIKAAKKYQKQLQTFFGKKQIKFDFVLLGMGEDGHVASLFPNSKEIRKINDLILVTDKAYDGLKRITMGLNLINEISYKLLLVNGEKKLKVLTSKNKSLPINKIKFKHSIYIK